MINILLNGDFMAKKKQQTSTRRERIVVPIYTDEHDIIGEKTGLKEVTSRNIREFLGLKPVSRKVGFNTQLKQKLNERLKTMSDEEKEELLNEFD